MNSKIGNIQLETPFLLAPLAGVTDAPFRDICSLMGASLVYTEMVSAKALYYKDKKTESLLQIFPREKNTAFQIFGHEEDIMAWATKYLEERENKIIDINMGCPVPKIVKNHEGSYLLKEPDKIYDIVSSVVKSTKKPVTCKIRMGFTEESINYLEVANAVFSAGGKAVTLHGRTREQFYQGKANWEAIRKLKEKFPYNTIIGNGDIFTEKDAFKMLDETGCDLVMIGRGALGNPFIFKSLNQAYERIKHTKRGFMLEYSEALKNGEFEPYKAGIEDKKKVMLKHLELEAGLKGENIAVKEMRKHVGWYFKGEKHSKMLRGEINQIADIDELREKIECL